ncbi:MAG: phosphatidate cytidylyltransferase [Gammaproteobacteria bacterium]|nr:phosphatidate cytidylyltransferase [Gammaproteobacteria bacterium]
MPKLFARTMTSIVLIFAVFYALFFLTPDQFAVISGLVIVRAAYEWGVLSGVKKGWPQFFYCNDIFILLLLAFFLKPIWLFAILVMGFVGWILMYLRYYQWAGYFLLPSCWKALNFLCFYPPRPVYLLTLLLIVWLADIAAYFIGCGFGKHKLAPSISPNKSVEGAVGAFLVVGLVVGLTLHSAWWILLAMITVGAAIIGDLFESAMKRFAGVKDSGNLLPGHGGLLDRIDSLILAAPVFTLVMLVLHLK